MGRTHPPQAGAVGRAASPLRRLLNLAGKHRELLANAGSMVGTTLATSLLGVVFWFVAARYFSQPAVGVAGASVSAMLLFGFVAALGLGTLLMGELPRRQDGRRALLNAALLASLGAGLVLGLGFALLAPLLTSNLSPLQQTAGAVLAFAIGTGLTGMTYVLDQALIGLLRGGLQLTRNVIFAAAKLVGLILVAIVVADPGASLIYSSWAAGILLSLLVLVPFYARRAGESLRPDFGSLHQLRRSAASHAVVNLALETADLAMPIIVVSLITPAENAGFYIAWLIVGFLVMIPLALSSVAYALGSGDDAGLEDRFRFTFLLSLALGVVAVLVLIPGAEPILGIFGSGYADTATGALQVLALGVFPLTVKTHYVAIHRVRRTLRRALPIAWLGTLLELGGGALGALLGGIEGVAWGWLAGLLIEALVMSRDVGSVCLPRRERAPAQQASQQQDHADQSH
jgi:O-antigen/teichoic acid export membrane protein